MKNTLKKLIKEELRRVLIEKIFFERLKINDPGNLHGDERTQREFIISIASENPFGLISISDIADKLNTTRDAVRNSYARLIRFYSDRSDFEKIIPEVPFKSAAVYQLVSRAKSAPIDKTTLEKIKREEEKKYGNTTGVYYSIYTYSKKDTNPIKIGYLNLREDDDIREYQKLLPKKQDIYGETYYYAINDKQMSRLSDEKKDKIITPEQFKEFIKKEFEND